MAVSHHGGMGAASFATIPQPSPRVNAAPRRLLPMRPRTLIQSVEITAANLERAMRFYSQVFPPPT
ncbi:hypothetical protein [Achromobacter ruhlandii]|uniref:hypothetical protein n=1 Tax=Achromobacter ruhlandii TaxID=72557 RepID=UPI000AD3F332|nr:hypothetical protein [Achromobacter ruhlandii]